MDTLDSLFLWFTAATIRGSVVILLVLLFQAALRRVISPQWRYALWLPALLVLIAPALPQSRWSAENLGSFAIDSWRAVSEPTPVSRSVAIPARATADIAEVETNGSLHSPTFTADHVNQPRGGRSAWRRFAAFTWITGSAALLLISLLAYARAWRRVLQAAVAPSASIQEMLTGATMSAGLSKAPRLIVSRAVDSPAVTGLFRPTLLLPADFPGNLGDEEAQLVMRHELVHLKRWDLPVNWLVCCIQAVHWCNPIVWLAAHRLRADREAACDAQVLELSAEDSRAAYGHALLKMEDTLASSGWTLGFVGIFERESGMRARIRAIACYRRAQSSNACVAATLLGALLLVGATTAQENGATTNARSEAPAKNAAAPVNLASPSTDNAARERVRRKLNGIVIPRLEFREASVRDALASLQNKSVELDNSEPDQTKRGVKISLKLDPLKNPAARPGAAVVDPGDVRITLSLANIPLAEALRYVTGLANLQFWVRSDGVEVWTNVPMSLITKEWVVDESFRFKAGDKVQAFLQAEGITFPEGTSASLSADGKRLTVRNSAENVELIDGIVEGAETPATAYDPIRRKLTTLIIPRLDLTDATLRETVDYLRKVSFDLDTGEKDAGKRGINIVIKGESKPAGAPPLIPGIPGIAPAAPAAPAAGAEPRLTLSLSDIPLGKALRYVASLSKKAISIEPYAIALVDNGASDGPMVTKEWRLTEAIATALHLKARDVDAEFRGRGVAFPPGAAAIWLPTTKRLIVRNTERNLAVIDDLVASARGEPTPIAVQTRAEALILPKLTFKGATLREAVDFIRAKSTAVDPEKKGVNVVLDVPAAGPETRITLSLTNASVWDALREITRIAGVQLTGEAQAIRIHGTDSSTPVK